MSESFHFQLSSWVKLFLTSLNLHEVLHCLSSIFWWSSSDCLCSVWCIYHVSMSWSFNALHALSLQFSSLISKTFSELLKLLSLLRAVQHLRFQACKSTWLNLVTSLTHFWFFERSDWLTSFVSLSSLFFSLFLLELCIFCKAMIDYLWVIALSLLFLLLLHWLMMMFWMWNAYSFTLVAVYWEVEEMSSTSVHSS